MRKILIFVFIAFLLAACGNTPAATAAPTVTETAEAVATLKNTPSSTPTRFHSVTSLPTLAPTGTPTSVLTSTPVPTLMPTFTRTWAFTTTPVPTLVAHEISQSEALVVLESYGGDGVCHPIPNTPELILFPDGELFINRFGYEQQVFLKQRGQLSRQETCKLLNSIDQAGFFDYDPATYISDPVNWPLIMGMDTTRITVQTWRSNSVDLYGLDDFIDDCQGCDPSSFPVLLSSIYKTYRLLADYHAENMENTRTDRVGVWSYGYGSDEPAFPWPFPSINLAEAEARWSHKWYDPLLILEGEDAEAVFDFFIQANPFCGNVIVSETGKSYGLAVRHLLPYEYPSTPWPAVSLSCSPADGWIEVP
jgi:hypothetical protein